MQLQHDRKISPAGGEFVLRSLHASGIYCLTKTHLMWSSQNALQQQRAKWGEQEREAGTSEAGMFPSSPQIPVEFTGMQGQVVRPQREGTGGSPKQATYTGDGLLNAKFTLLFLGQKRFVCSVRALASLKGEGPAGGSVPLGCLSGSLNPCPLSALAVASLLQ